MRSPLFMFGLSPALLIAASTWSTAASAQGGDACTLPCGYEMTEIYGPVIPGLGQTNLGIWDVNDAGVAVGNFAYLSGDDHPCIWTAEGGVQALATPPGFIFGTAVGINNNGWIIVNSQINFGGNRAWVLKPIDGGYGWIPIVPESPTGSWSIVGGINDLNQWWGGSPGGGQPYKGFFWSMETGRRHPDRGVDGDVVHGHQRRGGDLRQRVAEFPGIAELAGCSRLRPRQRCGDDCRAGESVHLEQRGQAEQQRRVGWECHQARERRKLVRVRNEV
ncbi:MAG: hypothetical protein U0575_05645 [Phycisphaerales bacterium]